MADSFQGLVAMLCSPVLCYRFSIMVSCNPFGPNAPASAAVSRATWCGHKRQSRKSDNSKEAMAVTGPPPPPDGQDAVAAVP